MTFWLILKDATRRGWGQSVGSAIHASRHAPSYRRGLAKIHAGFILGLTATPERTDGVDVATIFDDNLAYHATIGDGIAEDSLVPFHYIGVKDTMEPKIHDGQWCLFKPCPAGSRENRLLLVQVNTHIDPEDGGRYTIKRYHSTKRSSDAGGWQHQTIELQPLNQDYPTIHLSPEDTGDLRIIGELVGPIRESPKV